MSQHDMDVANQTRSLVRADLTAALQALASTSKGTGRPATPYQGQLWLDENTPSASVWTLNLYDGAQDIAIGTFDTTSDIFTVAGAARGLYVDLGAVAGDIGKIIRLTASGLEMVEAAPASFHAHRNGTGQTIAEATWTRIEFNNESWDTGSFFNTTTYRYVPNAGKHLLSLRGLFTGTTGAGLGCYLSIYKNGAEFATVVRAAGLSGASVNVEVVTEVTANGTDYFEAYAFVNGAAGAGATLSGLAAYTAFSGR